LAQGWNTWNTRSVLSHVHLPSGLALNLAFCHYGLLAEVEGAFFGEREIGATAGVRLAAAEVPPQRIRIVPGEHAADGSYTALTVELGEVRIGVESARLGTDDLVLWVTPTAAAHRPPALVLEAALLWNHPGTVEADGAGRLRARWPGGATSIHTTVTPGDEPYLARRSPSWVWPLVAPVGISTGVARTREEIGRRVTEARERLAARRARYGELADLQGAGQACLAWDTIYDPSLCRVLTTVSRPWNVARLGYGVFCWDSFFSAWMLAAEEPALARNAVRETLRERVDGEFVPNVVNGSGRRSADRSQPCVGGIAVLALHELAPDRTFLEEVWPALLAWNRWWHRTRRNRAGLLSWGSRPVPPVVGDRAEFLQPNTARGAALESGMDNSPVFDGVPFEAETHLLAASDVGLVSLYLLDCEALAQLARILGREVEVAELASRRTDYAARLGGLWNEARGIFENRRTDTGEFCARHSPMCFYPLLAGAATGEQVEVMIRRHLMNEQEFWGEWVLPAVPRSDPAFTEQHYWRGRVWAPLNFLVYLGLRRAGRREVARELAARSVRLFERNWRERRCLFENFSALTGYGGDVTFCDPLYPWTGLLVLMELMERGHVPLPSILRPSEPDLPDRASGPGV
jgi:hypothetical protein